MIPRGYCTPEEVHAQRLRLISRSQVVAREHQPDSGLN
uniref:Uncharacterized protein n=1 Tax=Pseudomonas aeruginosa TaxID=287 RepID=A0A7S6C734_PSEAI|nr:hypothetical protein [Pseudomonas aeruginosa]